jgi:hypothetical protein
VTRPNRLSRDGIVAAPLDLAMGYGLSMVAAVAGAIIAARQGLLHIVPPDSGIGRPVLGLHIYAWSFIIFVVVLVARALT